MAIETQEKVINGASYAVTQLPARRALRMKARLIKLFGPVAAQIFLTVSDKGAEATQKDNIVKAIELLGHNIEETAFENLIVDLMQGVRKNGVELQPAIIDMEFAGDIASLYLVAWFVLEVNYANFFQMLGIGSPPQEVQNQPETTKKTFMRK